MKMKYFFLVMGMIVFVGIRGSESNADSSSATIEDVDDDVAENKADAREEIPDISEDLKAMQDSSQGQAGIFHYRAERFHSKISEQNNQHLYLKPHRHLMKDEPLYTKIKFSVAEGILDGVEEIPKIALSRATVRAVDAFIDKGVEYWQEYWKTEEQKQAERLFFQNKMLHKQLLEHKLECAAIEQSIKSIQVALDCCDPDSPQAAILKAQLKQKVDMVIILNMKLSNPKLKIIDPETLTDENTVDSYLDDPAEELENDDDSNHDVLPAA